MDFWTNLGMWCVEAWVILAIFFFAGGCTLLEFLGECFRELTRYLKKKFFTFHKV